MCEKLLLIWKEPKERRRYIIGTLEYANSKYTFEYINPELNDAREHNFTFFPGFDELNKKYESEQLFPNIETRLPNKNRPDYLDILNNYNLELNSSKMEILKRTRGRLLTDNFEFLPAFDKNRIEFEIAGTRHSKDIEQCKIKLKINDNLYLEKEPNNKFDQHAIKVIYKYDNKNYHLGYVPRCYSKELTEMLNKEIKYSAKIQSINFNTPIKDEDITAQIKIIFDEKM